MFLFFFFHLKGERGEIDLRHIRRVRKETSAAARGLFDVACSRRQSFNFYPLQPICFHEIIYVGAVN